jgi:SSS family solute:Na+ symporter
MGGRRFGKLIQSFAAFGQSTSVENVTTTSTMVNANGAAGIWAMLASGLINLPIFWMTSIWYRRMRQLTLGDFFEERYGSRRMAAFYAGTQTIYFVLVAATGLTAMAKTVAAIAVKNEHNLTVIERVEYNQAITREKLEAQDYSLLAPAQKVQLTELQLLRPRKEFSYVNEQVLIAGVALVTLLYASIGGLAAAFIVDVVQGGFIILLSILLVPFAMARINELNGTNGFMGAFQVMHSVLPEAALEWYGAPTLIEFTWYWIAAFSILTIMSIGVQANQFTACGSAKDDATARFGFVSGVLMKRYATVMWGFLALLTLVLYRNTIADPDYIWGRATRDLLAPLGLGLVGLMIASLMAALMAAKSAFMLTASALVTNNIYRPMRPGQTEHHYLWAGRIFSAGYMITAALVAMQFNDVFGLFKMTTIFNCILAAAFWLGLLWNRANRPAAWISMLAMFVVTVLLPFGLPLIPGVREAPALHKTTHPTPVVRQHGAREFDVVERTHLIADWDARRQAGLATGERPAVLKNGERFVKTTLLPKKSVFWSEGLAFADGKTRGKGMLKAELVALDWMGWDLTRNSYSLNETLTFLFRIIFPFAVLILVSVLTKPEDPERLAQFYGKMRTPVVGTPEDDVAAMALTRANPRRHDHLKLFPNSAWEMRKWNREDWRGVLLSSLAAVSVVLLLILVVSLGG